MIWLSRPEYVGIQMLHEGNNYLLVFMNVPYWQLHFMAGL